MRRRTFIKSGLLFVPAILTSRRGLSQLPVIASSQIITPCSSSVVTAWASQVVTNGGAAPSAATKSALCTFVTGCQADGIWSKMISVCCFVPDNLIAAITPLIANAGNNPWTNHSFVSGDLTVNGLISDGSTKYLDTGVTPSANPFGAFDSGMTVYLATGSNETKGEMGCFVTSPHTDGWSLENNGGNAYFDAPYGVSGASRLGPIANSNWTGYFSGSRTSSTFAALYKANSGVAHTQIGSTSVTAVDQRSVVNFPICVFATPTAGSATGGIISRRLSFAAIHNGLSSTDSNNFYNRIQALRMGLGGGYV